MGPLYCSQQHHQAHKYSASKGKLQTIIDQHKIQNSFKYNNLVKKTARNMLKC